MFRVFVEPDDDLQEKLENAKEALKRDIKMDFLEKNYGTPADAIIDDAPSNQLELDEKEFEEVVGYSSSHGLSEYIFAQGDVVWREED